MARASSAADLGQPPVDRLPRPGALDEHGRVRRHDDAPRAPQRLGLDVARVSPASCGDDGAAGERGEVAEVMDAPVAEARSAHGDRLERAVLVVRDQHAERGAVDLLGQDDDRPRGLHDGVERRHEVLRVRDRLGRHEDVRVLEDRLHPRAVLDHVRRDPAVLDVDAFDEVDRDARQLGLLDVHDAVGADPVERVRDRLADDLVLLGRDRGDVLELRRGPPRAARSA